MAMEEGTTFIDLSSSTRTVLYVIGTCVVGFAIISATIVVQWFIALVKPLFSRPAQRKKKAKTKKQIVEEPYQAPAQSGSGQKSYKELVKESKTGRNKKAPAIDKMQGHPLFITSFKEHQNKNTAVDWMPDGSAMCTACEDQVVRVFDFSGGVEKGVKVRQIQTNGVPVGVGFIGEKNCVAVLMRGAVDAASLTLFTYGMTESGHKWVPSTKTGIFGQDHPMKMICTKSAAGGCPLIVCCSESKSAVVFDKNVDILDTFEPNSFKNHDLGVSHDGRFVSVGTFTADAKIWEIQYKHGSYKGCPKVMDLKGHSSQIMSVAFTMDSKKAVSVSKDGTLKVWNIDVWYQKDQDPACLLTVPLGLPKDKCYHRLAFGPGDALAAAYEGNIHFIDIRTGSVVSEIVSAHDGAVTALSWSPSKIKTKAGALKVLATVGKDHRARLWKSPF